MNVTVECTKCKQDLYIEDARTGLRTNEIIISVAICRNPDCYENEHDTPDCSQCEDLKAWQTRAEDAEAKLKNIRMFLDEDKPAQPDKFDSHKPIKIQSHAKEADEDKPGHSDLQPTSDVKSTGGYKVPGIKKDSAKNTMADYTKGLPG